MEKKQLKIKINRMINLLNRYGLILENFSFEGKLCKNGDSCHVSAPRGSRKGTQGEKSTEVRGIIPSELCIEILRSCEYKELKP